MGIQATQVPLELVWMALWVLLGYQDPQAGRVPQGMSFLPGQVGQGHLASLGLWGQKAFGEFLEAQDLRVSFLYI